MFAYVQIINAEKKRFNGFASFEFINGSLTLAFMRGFKKTLRISIPINEVTNLSENTEFGSRISFDYDNSHFVFLDSGFGESQFLKENIIQATQK
ncbi:hypothetical protein [Companilactobacillus versmoldensis]|nr:hypothetical protein [Companilactobacillus versmoldensis]